MKDKKVVALKNEDICKAINLIETVLEDNKINVLVALAALEELIRSTKQMLEDEHGITQTKILTVHTNDT